MTVVSAVTQAAATATGTAWLKKQAVNIGEGAPLPCTEGEANSVTVEAWLQEHGVEYAPPLDIPMILIDEKRSRLNQARRDAIVQDSVDRYAAAMKAGAKFPPIVAYISGGRLTIIDGNNRQAGARKAGKDVIFGIVISEETPSELIQLLTVEANAHHGVTPELSWRLMQADQLIGLGFSDAQAGRAASVTVPQIQTARRVKEADARARSLKIANFTDLPVYGRQALVAIKNQPVFYQAAKVAVDTGMTIEEIRDMIRGIKTQGSEGTQIDYIGEVARERGIEQATRKVMGTALNRLNSPKQSLVTAIGKLLKVDEAALIRNISTTYERDTVIGRVKLLEDKVLSIQVALEQLKEMEDL